MKVVLQVANQEVASGLGTCKISNNQTKWSSMTSVIGKPPSLQAKSHLGTQVTGHGLKDEVEIDSGWIGTLCMSRAGIP
ncbi:unnamed protein product [Prunus armeniaca]